MRAARVALSRSKLGRVDLEQANALPVEGQCVAVVDRGTVPNRAIPAAARELNPAITTTIAASATKDRVNTRYLRRPVWQWYP